MTFVKGNDLELRRRLNPEQMELSTAFCIRIHPNFPNLLELPKFHSTYYVFMSKLKVLRVWKSTEYIESEMSVYISKGVRT